jgi:DNA-binding transcriptional ArsR family regulator
MELSEAVRALASLAQASRLEVFRLLVGSPGALCAGEIAERLTLPKPTLSFHLKELAHAGLIVARREGRSIFYEVRPDGIRALLGFLTEDCCRGRAELCLPNGAGACC